MLLGWSSYCALGIEFSKNLKITTFDTDKTKTLIPKVTDL